MDEETAEKARAFLREWNRMNWVQRTLFAFLANASTKNPRFMREAMEAVEKAADVRE